MSPHATYIPLSDVLTWWPDHLFGDPGLGTIAITGYRLQQAAARATARLDLALGTGDDLVIPLIGLDGFAFVMPSTTTAIEVEYAGAFELRAGGFTASLRIASGLLVPVDGPYPNWTPRLDATGQPEALELALEVGGLVLDADFCPTLELTNDLALTPFMIGNTGIVVEVSGARLYLSGKETPPSGQPEGFRGVALDQVKIYLPSAFDLPGITPESLTAQGLVIGHGGVSGSFSAEWPTGWDGLTPVGAGAGTLLGLPFALKSVGVALTQNAVTSGVFAGEIGLPFFDQVLAVEVALDSAGALALNLGAADPEGLISLEIPSLGTLRVSSLSLDAGDLPAVLLNGSLQLGVLSPGVQWPAIDLQGLRITAAGDVELPGGWLDLQTPIALDLFGFLLEISQLGFGRLDDGRRWVGFSGGVHLVDFLPTGAAVEGLRVTWDPAGLAAPEVTLQGVGLELTLPGVLTLDGDVAFVNEATERYFKGNVKLALLPLGITLDASLKIGRDLVEDYKYVYTFLDVTLPVGLPLWATGAALYGLSGLYGMNVNPSATDGDWYGWYAGPPAPLNVTHTDKWIGAADGQALGAGLTLGTLFDLGRVVSVKGLFVLVLPGPVIMLHGKANFLQLPPNNDDPGSEGVLDALAVLDGMAGTLQLNVDAGYSQGQVLDIAASAEAFFNFSNPRDWHFYLGQDQPVDRRIRASLLNLLSGDAYLMIGPDGIATGAAISWGYDWTFGPVKVLLRAWIGAEAEITWTPPQLEGSLSLGGEFEISVAGFGIGLSAEATLVGKAPTLYWVRGTLHLTVKLPWPIKDLDETITLEWRQDAIPPSEDPFKSISLEHPKVDETWAVTSGAAQSALPGSSGYVAGPLVPLDARPSVAFDRGMKDASGGAFTSVDAYPGPTLIGDHAFDYELLAVTLEKWPKAGGMAWAPVEDLYGAWMAVEDGEGEPAFTRLGLWAKSPFAFTRQTARTYRDAFLAHHAAWPCVEPPEVVTHCVDFEDYKIGATFGAAFEHEGLSFALILSARAEVVASDGACEGTRALRVEDGLDTLWILFPEPVRTVELCVEGTFVAIRAYANGVLVAQVVDPEPGAVGLQASNIDSIALWTSDNCLLSRLCYQTEAMTVEYVDAYNHNLSVYQGLQRWSSADEILEPEHWYRLTVQERIVRTTNGDHNEEVKTHVAHFQTGGPPGLTPAWALDPAASGEPGASGEPPYPLGGRLKDLAPYVAWTIPADGAAPVYRAYDLGVEFNENYVEQMVGADMALRLSDANDHPVVDAAGAEVLFPNQWADQPTTELVATELAYTTRVEGCYGAPIEGYVADQKIAFANGVLLEESFDGDLTQWTDPHPEDGSAWVVAEGNLLYDNGTRPLLGAVLVAGDATWSDYALEVTLGDEGDDVGLAWRYTNDSVESYYRLRLNAFGRSLARVVAGVATELWEDATPYAPTAGQILAVHCTGARLRAQLGDAWLFDLEDGTALTQGQVGIFTNATAAFEHFLVRAWPGAALEPQTAYGVDLLASGVLFTDGLLDGWVDPAFAWSVYERVNARVAVIGREVWDDVRVEANAAAVGRQIGLIARFYQPSPASFSAYRLVVNLHESNATLARVAGTLSGTEFEIVSSVELWSGAGAACPIDFGLSTHHLVLRCEGEAVIVEVDGLELVRAEDPAGPGQGQAGLFHLGADEPAFSDLVVRSTRGVVHHWSFATSRYADFVEHLDSFSGQVVVEMLTDVNITLFVDEIAAAGSALAAAAVALATARAALDSAGPAEVEPRRTETQAAVRALSAESADRFAILAERLWSGAYRPLPPIVEVLDLHQDTNRLALLLESPEPLDWQRIVAQMARLDPLTGAYGTVGDYLLVWSDDGARALLVPTGTANLPHGDYTLQLTYSLDIGLEAPLLRRGASSLPEIASLRFTLG